MGNRLLWPPIVEDESKYNNHYFTSCCACLDKEFIILLCQILLSIFLLAFSIIMLILIGEKPSSTNFYIGIISVITGYWLGGTLARFIIGK